MKHKIIKLDTITLTDTISFKNTKKTLSSYIDYDFVCPVTQRYLEGGLFPTMYQVTKIKLKQIERDLAKDSVIYNVEIYGKKLNEFEFEKLAKKVKNG